MPKPTLEYPSPTADAVKALRADAELTMKQCAEMIGYTLRMWQFWESGAYAMPGFVFAEFQAQLKRKGLLKKKRSKAK